MEFIDTVAIDPVPKNTAFELTDKFSLLSADADCGYITVIPIIKKADIAAATNFFKRSPDLYFILTTAFLIEGCT
jgi:hypothetical protein